jgi:hypothetical protein
MRKGSNYTSSPSPTFLCGHPRDRTNMRFRGGSASCLQCARAAEARWRLTRRNKELLTHARPHLHPTQQAA